MLLVSPSFGNHPNYCPLEDIHSLCLPGPGPKFMLEASCNPFNPSDPQCFVRLDDDNLKTCYFCCQNDNDSFQKCSDVL